MPPPRLLEARRAARRAAGGEVLPPRKARADTAQFHGLEAGRLSRRLSSFVPSRQQINTQRVKRRAKLS